MSRYKLRVTDGTGQPSRQYDSGDNLMGVIKECQRMASWGFIGCRVEVIDSTIEHPDLNIVHVEVRES